MQENHFTLFKAGIDAYTLPERFTFPFYYEPHSLCLLAAQELQGHLLRQKDWQHNFGLEGETEGAIGKMFGVLLVENKQGEIGYLSAFSGKLADQNHLNKFVPPVFDMLDDDGFFRVGQAEINLINDQIKDLESNPQLLTLELALKAELETSNEAIQSHRSKMIEGRKNRKVRRKSAEAELSTGDFVLFNEQLIKESISDKNQLRDLTEYWLQRTQQAEESLNLLADEISGLKQQRKDLSVALQQKLFDQYQFLNKKGVYKSLADIFEKTSQKIPPAGAGECAAPKLLHYAFQHDMKPLALAEFWWGISPKSEIRQHKQFYGSCQGKCQPILAHMLEDIPMDDNPLLLNPAEGKTIDIVYQDEDMVIINKPADMLSVPGKSIEDSVYLRMKHAFPKASGPLIVHRLDMSTSGLMVIALSKDSHKALQKQFINRTVKKRYIALLDGELINNEGLIDLPLRVDLDDRPRQLVCYEYGRVAKTKWQVIERKNMQTRVYFYPITGRSHQLRVHSAHASGLNMPIVGDDLYGTKAKRLHLHAEYLELHHPVSRALMTFQIDAEF